MLEHVRSPFTRDLWKDVRPAIGTFTGLATLLLALRPRRRPPEGLEAAVKLASDACGTFSGLPTITAHNDVEGRAVSDAYWQSKEAIQQLNVFVPDEYRRNAEFWFGEGDEPDAAQLWRRLPLTAPLLAARFAWVGAKLTEGGCVGRVDADTGANFDWWTRSVAGQAFGWGISKDTCARVERVWRFIAAAGRLPVAGQDEELLEAFEAALLAGADEFAVDMVKG
jgi:hypothetical protein